ncbi:NF-kappa-B-repressing factor-like [Anopheles aquasalis]|uniref:NF-kappa-B-repressing factor-like n=1 Tax=Anopheles aquasalis TaxID=42839 RepID=UPI00215A3EB1|nr:NF-kappa-B-repressing factor-like [Anopheles aquasalis]XP_050100653.1 NF-kappa-B-repressing factor-like [Anopheles aquasalis]
MGKRRAKNTSNTSKGGWNIEPIDEPPLKKNLQENSQQGANRNTAFSFETYRSHHETEEHWELRRMFMEKNHHILPEDELVCLAQVFLNIELLHCRYPPETMRRVAELAEGIGKEYRARRSNMLQRTFVSASDAAASKVQRRAPCYATNDVKQDTAQNRGPSRNESLTMDEIFSKIVIVNNCIIQTTNEFNRLRCGVSMTDTCTELQTGDHEAVVMIGELVLGKAVHANKKNARQLAVKQALEYLGQRCYTLTRKKLPTQMSGANIVQKKDSEDAASKVAEEPKLDTKNIGFKLMQKLGWKGGGLGVKDDGIVDPITAQIKIGRKGLGNQEKADESGLDTKFIKTVLRNFKNSHMEYDLVFSVDFSKEDREVIHRIAKSFALRTKSFGNDNQGTRQLVVLANRLSPLEIIDKVLLFGDPTYCEMYEVVSPNSSEVKEAL